MKSVRYLACVTMALGALGACGQEPVRSSPGTVICDEIDVDAEVQRIQSELNAAEEGGDSETAGELRTELWTVGACDPELVEQWEEQNQG